MQMQMEMEMKMEVQKGRRRGGVASGIVNKPGQLLFWPRVV
jgi:hypothetical protein